MNDNSEIDYFGGCPICKRNDGYMNYHRAHWFFCKTHKTTWCMGSNLFSSWRFESEADWKENARVLKTYKVVEPVLPELDTL